MELQELSSIIEALLFISEKPLKVKFLIDFFSSKKEKVTEEQILEATNLLKDKYYSQNSGINIQEIAGGFQFVTKRELSPWVRAFLKAKIIIKLTRSSIETLSIIAYKQPVTKGEIDYIRGVDSSNPIKSLLFKKLIKIAGRKKGPGNPLSYATTDEFLRYFGLKDITELPILEELKNITEVEPETGEDENDSILKIEEGPSEN